MLDGWHRVRAARRAGHDTIPALSDEPDDPLLYVIRTNGMRRHMTKLQRCAVVLTAMRPLWSSHQDPSRMPKYAKSFGRTVYTNAEMAALAGTSKATVQLAKSAIRDGYGPRLISGKMTTSQYKAAKGWAEVRRRARRSLSIP